jgi:hypothetical protein
MSWFGGTSLLFVYLKPCNYNSSSTKDLLCYTFWMQLWFTLGLMYFCMDENTLASPISLHSLTRRSHVTRPWAYLSLLSSHSLPPRSSTPPLSHKLRPIHMEANAPSKAGQLPPYPYPRGSWLATIKLHLPPLLPHPRLYGHAYTAHWLLTHHPSR